MTFDPRMSNFETIRAAMRSGMANGAHPWLRPMWLKIQALEEEIKELKAKKPAPKRTKKTDEPSDG